jgi:hypothetical protein
MGKGVRDGGEEKQDKVQARKTAGMSGHQETSEMQERQMSGSVSRALAKEQGSEKEKERGERERKKTRERV